ncbi:MAG: GNAT family N-acetyltransferase [Gammaproteobacteria bacterium]|nr:GNAT family N-acetyltransferase [Gammaproteobacteria bacterium]MYF01905.1 GNAT family N-acetyltransferase [Gammaproteobacteria bacterium]MYI76919.1 GNAT family N-acetyltransferase [Gammaproteobacteria bacterium]
MNEPNVLIREASWTHDRDSLYKVRLEVFVQEQHVPQDLELDGLDATAVHFLAFIDETPVGTARLLPSGKIGRMAVLIPYRNQGIGAKLLHATLIRARELGYYPVFLHAQLSAADFYLRHGFQPYGDVFEEADIEHQAMRYQGVE